MSWLCETHWSFLCGFGQGLCQIAPEDRCDVRPTSDDLLERGYRCSRRKGHDSECGFRAPKFFTDEKATA